MFAVYIFNSGVVERLFITESLIYAVVIKTESQFLLQLPSGLLAIPYSFVYLKCHFIVCEKAVTCV